MSESHRSQGYVTDSVYPDKFFRELSPTWLNYVAALNGGAPRDLTRPFTYLELGAGLGHSAVANAGAFARGEFHACDVNAAHVAGALRHAELFGIGNVQIHEASFEELLALDLPDFDFIVLHGVYSWVGASARAAIRSVLATKLKPLGIAYVSYNCLPGWASEMPLRRLLIEFARSAEGDSAQRSAAALQALAELAATSPRYLTANPQAQSAIDAYAKRPSTYLAHEFMNETWEPFYSIDVADELAPAGLRRIGSATLADNHLPLCVDERCAETIARLPTARQREIALDFAVNRRFRRDVFQRGAAEPSPAEMLRNLNAVAFGCVGEAACIDARARVPRGEIRFQDGFVAELRALVARGSFTVGDAAVQLGGAGRDAAEITRNLIYLIAAGALQPFAVAREVEPARQPPRFATPAVERAVAHAAETGTSRAAPSAIVGNGVVIDAAAAVRAVAALANGELDRASDALLGTWRRIGLIV
jgi:SAM-dependent methyltransferase